jgi:hypothetical protein
VVLSGWMMLCLVMKRGEEKRRGPLRDGDGLYKYWYILCLPRIIQMF